MRAVVDTNVLLRALLRPGGPIEPVFGRLLLAHYILVYSQALLDEFIEVTGRPRIWARYFRNRHGDVNAAVNLIRVRGQLVVPERRITVCRDPKDNMVLEAAVAGRADLIVSGDQDLLVLHPFEGIPVVGPSRFLALLAEQASGESLG